MKNKFYVYRENNKAQLPTKNNDTDAGYDLYSTEEVTIGPNERKLVPVGVRVVAEEGFYYSFAPRSGMAFKHNVIPSHHNVMDALYTGDCSVLMHNRSDKDFTIANGDKFCQIVFYEVPDFDIIEVNEEGFDNLVNISERKEKGFGSSGK